MIDYLTVVNAGDSEFRVGDHAEKSEILKINADLKDRKKKLIDFEPFSFYLSAWEEDRHVIAQANAEIDDKGRIVAELVNARKAGNFVLVKPRRSRLHRRQPEAAGFRSCLAGAVPGTRRCQPRSDGREHAASVGAVAARAGAARRHGNGRRHGARLRRGGFGSPLRHHRFRRLRAHHRARRRRASSHAALARSGQRHLSAHQVQALQPEHLYQPAPDREEAATAWPRVR